MADRAVRVLGWNLFHGRDRAPQPGLHTWRSRLTRRTERGDTHAQVNLDLLEQFATVLADAEWDVALLQECPPRWAESLATRCRAESHLVLTARNLPPLLAPLQRLVAGWNPDLIASWEGGSNLTLARGAFGAPVIRERRQLTLTRRPETRRMAFTVLRNDLCVANLHASEQREAAEADVRLAAATATAWARERPLVFGGDLNLRPASSPSLFAELERELGLAAPTGAAVIDHLLVRGMDVLAPAARWPPARREIADPTADPGGRTLPIRLSDHAPVEAAFSLRA